MPLPQSDWRALTNGFMVCEIILIRTSGSQHMGLWSLPSRWVYSWEFPFGLPGIGVVKFFATSCEVVFFESSQSAASIGEVSICFHKFKKMGHPPPGPIPGPQCSLETENNIEFRLTSYIRISVCNIMLHWGPGKGAGGGGQRAILKVFLRISLRTLGFRTGFLQRRLWCDHIRFDLFRDVAKNLTTPIEIFGRNQRFTGVWASYPAEPAHSFEFWLHFWYFVESLSCNHFGPRCGNVF